MSTTSFPSQYTSPACGCYQNICILLEFLVPFRLQQSHQSWSQPRRTMLEVTPGAAWRISEVSEKQLSARLSWGYVLYPVYFASSTMSLLVRFRVSYEHTLSFSSVNTDVYVCLECRCAESQRLSLVFASASVFLFPLWVEAVRSCFDWNTCCFWTQRSCFLFLTQSLLCWETDTQENLLFARLFLPENIWIQMPSGEKKNNFNFPVFYTTEESLHSALKNHT